MSERRKPGRGAFATLLERAAELLEHPERAEPGETAVIAGALRESAGVLRPPAPIVVRRRVPGRA